MKYMNYVPNSVNEPKVKSRAAAVAQNGCAFRLNWLPLEHDSLYDSSYADLKPSEAGYIENTKKR